MPRFTVQRFDSETWLVVDGRAMAEYCVCASYDGEALPAQERACHLAAVLNALEAG